MTEAREEMVPLNMPIGLSEGTSLLEVHIFVKSSLWLQSWVTTHSMIPTQIKKQDEPSQSNDLKASPTTQIESP